MHLGDRWTGILTTFAAVGIAAGSLAAGRLSGDKVEPGLAPIGAIGMGVFAVPLNALLQQKSGDEEKGRLMATNNFLNVVAIMAASGALWLTRDVLAM